MAEDRTVVEIVSASKLAWPNDSAGRLAVLIDLLPKLKGRDFEKVREMCHLLRAENSCSDSSALREYFEAQEARRIQNWRTTASTLNAERKSILSQDVNALKEQFMDMAKASMFTADEVLISTCVIHGTPEDLRFLAGLMMRRRGFDRIVAHNFFVGRIWLPTADNAVAVIPGLSGLPSLEPKVAAQMPATLLAEPTLMRNEFPPFSVNPRQSTAANTCFQ